MHFFSDQDVLLLGIYPIDKHKHIKETYEYMFRDMLFIRNHKTISNTNNHFDYRMNVYLLVKVRFINDDNILLL